MARDLYEVLEVERTASLDEIKKGFRKLARQYHPDVAGDDPDAEGRFKEIAHAYEVLSDPERRRRYDTFGDDGTSSASAGPGGFGAEFGLGDLFDAFFGGDPMGGRRGPAGPPRGSDAELPIELELAEAVFGVTRTFEAHMIVECERCASSGCEPGTHPSTCRACDGAGQVRQVRRTLLGQMVTARPCLDCGGMGQKIPTPCTTCHGGGVVTGVRRLEVPVPAGIDDGQRLKLAGRGPAAPRGGAPGDLYVRIRVREHPEFVRRDDDLVHHLRVPMTQAVLGAKRTIKTLDGERELIIPPGTQPGRVFRLRHLGVPELRGRGRGDLIVEIDVEIPDRLTREESDLMRRFAEMRGEEVAATDPGLLSRIKSAFQ